MATIHNLYLTDQDSLNKIERFAEDVSNYYHLDDTYFSNVIVCLDTLKTFCDDQYKEQKWALDIEVFSDRKGLVFSVKDKGDILNAAMVPEEFTAELLDSKPGEMLFTLGSLTDSFTGNADENTLELTFSTHSMHKDLAIKRVTLLHEYFNHHVKVRSN